jgi:hypothetical protein
LDCRFGYYYFDNQNKEAQDVMDFIDKVKTKENEAGFNRFKLNIDFGVITEQRDKDNFENYEYEGPPPNENNTQKTAHMIM